MKKKTFTTKLVKLLAKNRDMTVVEITDKMIDEIVYINLNGYVNKKAGIDAMLASITRACFANGVSLVLDMPSPTKH